jgi:predicted small lipoprotein YifL
MSKKPFIILSVLAGLTLAGCGEKGPAEQAGEKVDKAVEQTKDAAQQAGEKVEKAVDDAAQKTEQAVDQSTGEKKDAAE